MPHPALVVIGASAGGVEALRALVAGLPADLEAAVLVVLHIPRSGPSALPRILDRAGVLPATAAVDGEALRPGRILVAPADHHLLVLDGRVRLSHGPAENGHRPAIDPLFRSAAWAVGPRTVAVVLSGSRDDGTAGAATVAESGGRVLIQDPDDALHPSMPRSVMEHVAVDVTCPAVGLGPAVAAAVRALPAPPSDPAPTAANPGPAVDPPPAANPPAGGSGLPAVETAMADLADLTTDQLPARPTGLGCPSCHGGLFELPGEPFPRYRCRVGHAWSPESLLDEQAVAFEGALWIGLRSLEERSSLAHHMAAVVDERRGSPTADRYRWTAREASEAARLIRDLIRRLGATGADEPVQRRRSATPRGGG